MEEVVASNEVSSSLIISGESCSNKKGASASVVVVKTECALGEFNDEPGFDGL